MMTQSTCKLVFMSFLVVVLPLLSSCVEETDKVPLPNSTYAFTSSSQSSSDVFTRMSCGFSRQAETEGQYFVDGRALELEGATEPAVVILNFPGAKQLAPAPGSYTIPDDATLQLVISQRSTGADGTLTASAGTVTVTETADYRRLIVKEASVTNAVDTGTLEVTFHCGL